MITAGDGADMVMAGDGDDMVDGGTGDDSLSGGSGVERERSGLVRIVNRIAAADDCAAHYGFEPRALRRSEAEACEHYVSFRAMARKVHEFKARTARK